MEYIANNVIKAIFVNKNVVISAGQIATSQEYLTRQSSYIIIMFRSKNAV